MYESSFDETSNREKFESERNHMKQIASEIESNKYYSQLNDKERKKIQNQIKEGKYLIQFEGNNIKVFNWSHIYKAIGLKDIFFENIYSYFSLYTHPSNVSVFQFQDVFKPNEFGFLEMSNFNTKVVFLMLGVFVADLIKVFPELKNSFNGLDSYKQIVIDRYNTMARGGEFALLEGLKEQGRFHTRNK